MSSQNTVRITSLANIVEILPFLLGHYPDDSMVLHLVGPNFIDGLTMTCPLPDDPADWEKAAQAFACNFSHIIRKRGHNLDSGIIVYLCREPRADQTADETAEQLRPVADWLTDTLHDHRGTVLQTLGLVSDRWWAYECPLPECCNGEPLPDPDDPNSVTAQLIQLGRTPGRRANEIAKEFQPTEPEDASDLLRALENESEAWTLQINGTPSEQDAAWEATQALLETAMRDFRAGATELAHDVAARLIHGLHDEWAMDYGLEFIEDDDLPDARRLWAFLARRCIPPHTDAAVPALTLLAAVAWRQDDLPTARLALRQALTADPEDDLADALHGAINSGVDATSLLSIARKGKAERLARTRTTDTRPN